MHKKRPTYFELYRQPLLAASSARPHHHHGVRSLRCRPDLGRRASQQQALLAALLEAST